jgi:hypothetical protein
VQLGAAALSMMCSCQVRCTSVADLQLQCRMIWRVDCSCNVGFLFQTEDMALDCSSYIQDNLSNDEHVLFSR